MSRSITLLIILVLTTSSVIAFLPVKADGRTIVVPDNYHTISSAIGNATDGDTILVKKGTYEEKSLKIDKTLSLIGEGADSTRISFDPSSTRVTVSILEKYLFYDDPIEVHADGFQMSGFTIVTTGGYIAINGNGTEITGNKILTDLHVEGSHLSILENTFSGAVSVSGSHCKIYANDGGFSLQVTGSYFDISENIACVNVQGSFCLINRNNATNAPYSSFSVSGNDNFISKNIIDHLQTGLEVSGSNNTVISNQITHCGWGLSTTTGTVFYANYVANNLWGIYWNTQPNQNVNASVFFHNNIINNVYQVDTVTFVAHEPQHFDNGKVGNYWSNYYNGKDADADGIGDKPYLIDTNRSDRYPLMVPFDINGVSVEFPEWASPPSLNVISPKNTTYTSANVTLEFTINKQTSWMGYSLDGHETQTIMGNTTLSGLSKGLHNVTISAKDAFENIVTYGTIWFSVTEPFATTLVIAAFMIIVAAVGIVLSLYFKKRKRGQPT